MSNKGKSYPVPDLSSLSPIKPWADEDNEITPIKSWFDIIGRDPTRWVLSYDILGWTISQSNADCSIMLADKYVPVIQRMIHQAPVGPFYPLP